MVVVCGRKPPDPDPDPPDPPDPSDFQDPCDHNPIASAGHVIPPHLISNTSPICQSSLARKGDDVESECRNGQTAASLRFKSFAAQIYTRSSSSITQTQQQCFVQCREVFGGRPRRSRRHRTADDLESERISANEGHATTPTPISITSSSRQSSIMWKEGDGESERSEGQTAATRIFDPAIELLAALSYNRPSPSTNLKQMRCIGTSGAVSETRTRRSRRLRTADVMENERIGANEGHATTPTPISITPSPYQSSIMWKEGNGESESSEDQSAAIKNHDPEIVPLAALSYNRPSSSTSLKQMRCIGMSGAVSETRTRQIARHHLERGRDLIVDAGHATTPTLISTTYSSCQSSSMRKEGDDESESSEDQSAAIKNHDPEIVPLAAPTYARPSSPTIPKQMRCIGQNEEVYETRMRRSH